MQSMVLASVYDTFHVSSFLVVIKKKFLYV